MRLSDIVVRSFATQLFAWDEETRGSDWFAVMLDVAEERGLEAALEFLPASHDAVTNAQILHRPSFAVKTGLIERATVFRLEDETRSPRVICIGQEVRQRPIGRAPLSFPGRWRFLRNNDGGEFAVMFIGAGRS